MLQDAIERATATLLGDRHRTPVDAEMTALPVEGLTVIMTPIGPQRATSTTINMTIAEDTNSHSTGWPNKTALIM